MDWNSPETLALIGLAAHFLGSLLNTFVSSNSGLVGKIINAFALGFGKATPDPAKQ